MPHARFRELPLNAKEIQINRSPETIQPCGAPAAGPTANSEARKVDKSQFKIKPLYRQMK